MQGMIASGVLAVVVAIAFSIAGGVIGGGVIGGVVVGGKTLGNELAALMGGFYGPLAGADGVLLAVIIVAIAL